MSISRVREGMLRQGALAAMLALGMTAAGCLQWMPGDAGVSLYLLNRSEHEYVVAVGQNTGQCYALAPDAYGQVFGGQGSVVEPGELIALYRQDGTLAASLHLTANLVLYVIDERDRIVETPVTFDAGTDVMRVPQVPEADGLAAPGYLPASDHDACFPL